MPNPQKTLWLLLLAAIGLSAGCSTLPSAPTEESVASEPEGAAEPLSEDAVAGPIPNIELSGELLYRLLIAEFAGQSGNPRLSAEQYLKTAEETADPRLAKRAARAAMYGNDGNLALRAATLWRDLAPDDLEASQALAGLLIGAGRTEEARPHLERIINTPAMRQGHGYLVAANLLARDSDKARARALMKELSGPHQQEAEPLFAYASLAAQQENTPVALQGLDQLLQLHPGHLQGLILKARLLHEAGRKEEALASLAAAVKQAPDNTQLRMIYARMLVDERRLDEARREFLTIDRQAPDNPDVVYALGLLALQANAPKEGERYFQRLLKLEQREAEANYALGQIAESRNEIDQAIDYYDAVDSGENALEARLRAAVLIAQRDGVDEGRDYLHTLAPDNAADIIRVALVEGELLREAQRPEEAMAVYDETLVLFPDTPELLYARAMVAERIDRLDILEQDLRTILRQDPDNTQALNTLGYTLADRTNRFDEAYQLVEHALRLAPNDAAILDSMGWVLYRQGRHAEALGYLRQALALQNDGEIAAHLGEVLWAAGEQSEARKVWDEALKQSPNHPLLRQTVERFIR